MDTMIQMINVNKWFGNFHVLKKINLTVLKGERIVICGPSGSGKSTLIRCINRLEEHQEGKIVVDGTELTKNIKHIERIRSEVGMVFQSFNLFPHMTILQNLTFAYVFIMKIFGLTSTTLSCSDTGCSKSCDQFHRCDDGHYFT